MALMRIRQRLAVPRLLVGNAVISARAFVTITSAQLLALNATPITLVAAPGAGQFLVCNGLVLQKPAGTAYAGIAVGEDLSVKYTDASGLEVAGCESVGFLDQATAQTRYASPYAAASAISSFVPVVNAPFVLHMLAGEIITGTSVLRVLTFYSIFPSVPTA